MLGGHVGTYVRIWYFIRYKNLSVEEALEKMKIEAMMHLKSCIEQVKNQTNVLLTLDQFVGKNQCEVDHWSNQCEVKFTDTHAHTFVTAVDRHQCICSGQ